MHDFEELMAPSGEYRLSGVSLAVSGNTVRWSATLEGPANAQVWARAWISDEDGTLAETAIPAAVAGDRVTIEVTATPASSSCITVIRIESKPLETEHILMRRLATKTDQHGKLSGFARLVSISQAPATGLADS